MNRPEEPTEWAGLPSEPWESASPAETLDSSAVPDALALVGDGVASVSVSIPLEAAEDAPNGEAPATGDARH